MSDTNLSVNFFAPKSDHARTNRNIIMMMVVVWAVAVFGFQALLIVLEKPTPEQALVNFNQVWSAVSAETATPQEKQTFAKSILNVIGKNTSVKAADKDMLKTTISWAAYSLMSDTERADFNNMVQSDKAGAAKIAATAIALTDEGLDLVRASLLPSSLVPVQAEALSADIKEKLPTMMAFYMTHNQSVLTDTTFIGFPFHYWYTAQFLLILFIGLCLFYSIVMDKINKKYDFVEDE